MTPAVDRRQLILCSKCLSHIGDMLTDGRLRVRHRDGWTTLRAELPDDSMVSVHCDGCGIEGTLDMDVLNREAHSRRPIRARLRRVEY